MKNQLEMLRLSLASIKWDVVIGIGVTDFMESYFKGLGWGVGLCVGILATIGLIRVVVWIWERIGTLWK